MNFQTVSKYDPGANVVHLFLDYVCSERFLGIASPPCPRPPVTSQVLTEPLQGAG